MNPTFYHLSGLNKVMHSRVLSIVSAICKCLVKVICCHYYCFCDGDNDADADNDGDDNNDNGGDQHIHFCPF